MARTASTAAGLIDGTPLVRVNHVAGDGVDAVVEVEAFNPASSVENYTVRSIIDTVETSGTPVLGGAIVEATSGNTGIALSTVGAAYGYKVVIVISTPMSVERHAIVRAFDAELVLTDPEGGVSIAVAEAERTASERPGAIIASQFTNPASPAAHVTHTGEEIWADTDGQVDVFVAGVGTGDTIFGVAKVFKEKNPSVCIIAIQPTESPLLTGGTPDSHDIQGLMPDFAPEAFDMDIVDEVISVETAYAFEFARRAVVEKGLLVGISSGAALAGVAAVAARPGLAGKKVVALLPDTGERYLSTALLAGLED